MERDALSRLWKSQPDGLSANGEEILMDVKRRAEKFDRKIRRRDWRELAGGVLGIGIAVFSIDGSRGAWPWVGLAIFGLSMAWVLVRLFRARRAHEGPTEDLDLRQRLRREIAKVDTQISLLRRVASWYVAPIAAGSTLWTLSLVLAKDLPAMKAWLVAGGCLALMAAIWGLLGTWVVRLNRKAVETELEPYRRDLEGLLQGLAAD